MKKIKGKKIKKAKKGKKTGKPRKKPLKRKLPKRRAIGSRGTASGVRKSPKSRKRPGAKKTSKKTSKKTIKKKKSTKRYVGRANGIVSRLRKHYTSAKDKLGQFYDTHKDTIHTVGHLAGLGALGLGAYQAANAYKAQRSRQISKAADAAAERAQQMAIRDDFAYLQHQYSEINNIRSIVNRMKAERNQNVWMSTDDVDKINRNVEIQSKRLNNLGRDLTPDLEKKRLQLQLELMHLARN